MCKYIEVLFIKVLRFLFFFNFLFFLFFILSSLYILCITLSILSLLFLPEACELRYFVQGSMIHYYASEKECPPQFTSLITNERKFQWIQYNLWESGRRKDGERTSWFHSILIYVFVPSALFRSMTYRDENNYLVLYVFWYIKIPQLSNQESWLIIYVAHLHFLRFLKIYSRYMISPHFLIFYPTEN